MKVTSTRRLELNRRDRARIEKLLAEARAARTIAAEREAKAKALKLAIAKREARGIRSAARERAALLPPLSMTAVARWYRDLYGEPWPEGWTVQWSRDVGRRSLGDCYWHLKRIRLSAANLSKYHPAQAIETLIHEIVHMRHPKLRHGVEFQRLVRQAYLRAGGSVGDGVCPLTRAERRARWTAIEDRFAAEKEGAAA
jgi:hypothetical protein